MVPSDVISVFTLTAILVFSSTLLVALGNAFG